ncbi:hypothetical protein VTN00DRAFT_6914 [Thermoascus crustaceus]|uniref:uncharacterized protein n=1 Tax=Thermoascus crustaceus TaxID=5088 RepID=UPI00374353DF
MTLKSYFEYYTSQSDIALHDCGRHVSVRTHQDIIEISDYLRQGLTRDAIEQRLHLRPQVSKAIASQERALDASINLSVRLLLMLEIGCIQNTFSGYKALTWECGSLQEFVSNLFGHPQKSVKLEKIFIARNLWRIACIDRAWMNNLADHLRMLEHDTKVAIFHHASFLQTLGNR